MAVVRGASGDWWRWIGLGLLLAAGAYVRAAGLVVAPAVLAWAWWGPGRRTADGGRRTAGIAALTFGLVMLPWWVRDASLAGGWRYAEELLSTHYRDPAAGIAGPVDLLARLGANVAFYLGRPAQLGPAGLAFEAALIAALALGWWQVVRASEDAAAWAAPVLVLAALSWPIQTGRYLLPALPLACVYLVAGVRTIVGSVAQRPSPLVVAPLYAGTLGQGGRGSRSADHYSWPGATVAIALAALALAEVGYAGALAARNLAALRGASGPAQYYRGDPDWSHFLAAADWLRAHAAPGDVVMTRRHFALYVYSGRFTEKYRFDTTADELSYLTSGAAGKYVLEDSFDELRGEFGPLPAALRARGGDLMLRFSTAEPAVRVWELVRPCC